MLQSLTLKQDCLLSDWGIMLTILWLNREFQSGPTPFEMWCNSGYQVWSWWLRLLLSSLLLSSLDAARYVHSLQINDHQRHLTKSNISIDANDIHCHDKIITKIWITRYFSLILHSYCPKPENWFLSTSISVSVCFTLHVFLLGFFPVFFPRVD